MLFAGLKSQPIGLIAVYVSENKNSNDYPTRSPYLLTPTILPGINLAKLFLESVFPTAMNAG
jgi:hypothetical protein